MRIFVGALGLVFSVSSAFGWGSYGHQQVNRAAVELLQKAKPENPASICLGKNQMLIQRLAITPDYDWKILGKKLDENFQTPIGKQRVRDPRRKSDVYEHPLHFFEVDAFVPGDQISTLPSGSYADAAEKLISLRTAQADVVAKLDPAKSHGGAVDIDTVRAHGSAPWRIQQLYHLGVSALKTGHTEEALIYLGAMGHYVGDMSQPFHASLNFDGDFNPTGDLSSGIHSAFETTILQMKTAKADPDSFLFSDFSTTDDAVVAVAQEVAGDFEAVHESEIPARTFDLIASGYPWIDRLLNSFATARKVAAEGKKTKNKTARHKKDQSRKVAAAPQTPYEVAEARLGAASALLSRLWLTAFADAGVKSGDCQQFEFNRRMTIEKYPVPAYLPKNHRVNLRSHDATETVSFAPQPKAATMKQIRAFAEQGL